MQISSNVSFSQITISKDLFLKEFRGVRKIRYFVEA